MVGRMMNRLHVYELLFRQHGPQGWWPSQSPFETMVGAVLTQRTAWLNAVRAIDALRRAGLLTPARMRAEPVESLAAHIRASGFFRAKARKLHALCGYLASHGDDVEALRSIGVARLRAELLAVHGVGPETADAIMLYAVGVPTFVVDAYAERVFSRLGEPSATKGYGQLQAWLMDGLPADAELLGEYHALLVRHGREMCTARQPRCHACSLRRWCATATRTQPSWPTHPRAPSNR